MVFVLENIVGSTEIVKRQQMKGRRGGGETVTARKLAAELWRVAEIADYNGGVRWRYGLFELCSSLRIYKSTEETKKWNSDVGDFKNFSRNMKLHRNEDDHADMCALLERLKYRVERERRIVKKMDSVNLNLLSDIAKAKLSAQKLTQSFKNEKKARELSQNACKVLTKEIESKRREIEKLKNQCARIRDEVDEEKKMMQVADVWREERARMKIVDAKLILEDKYNQMNSLIQELEAYLRSSKKINEAKDCKDLEVLRQPTKEFSNDKLPRLDYQYASEQITKGDFQSSLKKISFDEKTKSSVSLVRDDVREVRNPHVVRAMKGRVEWPRVIQRQAKIDTALKLKFESEKMLLRSMLKHKT